MSFSPDADDLKILTEVGFSAAVRGIGDQGGPTFAMLQVWQPHHAAGAVGVAVGAMGRGDYNLAEQVLTRAVDIAQTGREDAMAVLAMCKLQANKPTEAQQICTRLQGAGGGAEALARTLMPTRAADQPSPDHFEREQLERSPR